MTIAEILEACLNTSDQGAWIEFVQRFQPLIAASVFRVMRRYGASHAPLADDLIQETYLRLCRNNCRALRTFEARHESALLGYLKVVATTVAIDYFRAQSSQKRRVVMEEEVDHSEVGAAPFHLIEQSALLEELDRFLACSQTKKGPNDLLALLSSGLFGKGYRRYTNFWLDAEGIESCIYRLTQLLRDSVKESPGTGREKRAQNALGVRE